MFPLHNRPGEFLTFKHWYDHKGRRCTTAMILARQDLNDSHSDLNFGIGAVARCSLNDRFSRLEGRVRSVEKLHRALRGLGREDLAEDLAITAYPYIKKYSYKPGETEDILNFVNTCYHAWSRNVYKGWLSQNYV